MSDRTGEDRTGRASRASIIIVALVLAVYAFYFLVPLWTLFVAATKPESDLGRTNGLWLSHFDLVSNLSALFSYNNGIFGRWLLNSMGYSLAGALVATFISALAGYYIAKFEFPGRGLLFGVVLGAVMVPATTLALPLFLMFAHVGLVDSVWAVFLPSVVSPFGVFLARIYATTGVPTEIIEAARLDGAGELRIFFSVVQNMMRPALVTIFLFSFVAIWNNFFLPLVMLQTESLFPSTLGLFEWRGARLLAPQLDALIPVGSMVTVIPLLIAFIALQRYWRRGLTAGALNG